MREGFEGLFPSKLYFQKFPFKNKKAGILLLEKIQFFFLPFEHQRNIS